MSRAAATIVATWGAKRRTPTFMIGRKAGKSETRQSRALGSSAASAARVRSAGMKLTVATRVSGSRPVDPAPEMGEGQHEVGVGSAPACGRRGLDRLEQHRLDPHAIPEARLEGLGVVAGGVGKKAEHDETERARPTARREHAGAQEAAQLLVAHAHGPRLGEQAIDGGLQPAQPIALDPAGPAAATKVPCPDRAARRPASLSSL